jgi:Diaphanous FH3 Domain
MQFVNIIVHSVEDMNFRVHLQYEFTTLGLDQYLESLRHTESEELKVRVEIIYSQPFIVEINRNAALSTFVCVLIVNVFTGREPIEMFVFGSVKQLPIYNI